MSFTPSTGNHMPIDVSVFWHTQWLLHAGAEVLADLEIQDNNSHNSTSAQGTPRVCPSSYLRQCPSLHILPAVHPCSISQQGPAEACRTEMLYSPKKGRHCRHPQMQTRGSRNWHEHLKSTALEAKSAV